MFKFEPRVELTSSAELFDADYSAYIAKADDYLSHRRAIIMFNLHIYPEPAFVCNDSVNKCRHFDFFT